MSWETNITAGYLAANYVPYAGANANVNLGSFNLTTTGILTGSTLVSTLASGGAAPMTITSTTKVSNLNVDYVDGVHVASLTNGKLVRYNSTGTQLESATVAESSGALSAITTISMSGQLTNTLAIGTSPFVITSTTVCANLNADLWDGYQFSDYLDQSVKQASSPTFATPTVTGITIGANTLTTAEWAYLDGQDQAVAKASTPQFTGLTVGASGITNPLPAAVVPLYIGRDGANCYVSVGTASSANNYDASMLTLSRGRGTHASPTPVLSGDFLGVVAIYGQYDTTVGHVANSAYICWSATENWTSTKFGTCVEFGVVPTGTGAVIPSLKIDQNGDVICQAGDLIQDDGVYKQKDGATYYHTLDFTSTGISADRTLTIDTVNADRTLTISGNATISQDYSTTGTPQFARLGLGMAAHATDVFSILSADTTNAGNVVNISHSGSVTGSHTGINYVGSSVCSVEQIGQSVTLTGLSAKNTALTLSASGSATANVALNITAGNLCVGSPTYSAIKLVDILQTSTVASSVGLNILHSGLVAGGLSTVYGQRISVTGANAVNIGLDFSAGVTGATTNYLIYYNSVNYWSSDGVLSASYYYTTLVRPGSASLLDIQGRCANSASNIAIRFSSLSTLTAGTDRWICAFYNDNVTSVKSRINTLGQYETLDTSAAFYVRQVFTSSVALNADRALTFDLLNAGRTLAWDADSAFYTTGRKDLATITNIADLGYYGEALTGATVDANAQGVGSLLYAKTADSGHYAEALATASTTVPCVAMALETGTGTKKVLLRGIVRNDAWAGWTVGGLVYVSKDTAGVMTQTAPAVAGQQIQIVGFALASKIIYFNPNYGVVEV